MSELATELRKLAALKRNKANLKKIQDKLAELREITDTASEIPDLIASAVTALRELADAIGATDADNPLVPVTLDEIEAMISALPGGGGDSEGVTPASLVEDAESAISNYEEIADDRDYPAEAKNEAWHEIADSLDNLASYFDPKGAPGA